MPRLSNRCASIHTFRSFFFKNCPHFKDRGAKLRTFLGTFAKNSLSRVGFNRNYDNFLSFTPPFLPKSEVAHTRLHPLGPVYLFRKMSTYSGKCLSIQDDPGVSFLNFFNFFNSQFCQFADWHARIYLYKIIIYLYIKIFCNKTRPP